jgi:hypothetical protein
MKNRFLLMALFMANSVFFISNASAQLDMEWKGSGGWGPGSNYSKLFDPKTVETIKVSVVSFEELLPEKDMFKGLTMVVKPARGETIPVHLGPKWYLENQDVKILPGDKVEVTGSRVTFKEKPAIIAQSVVKEGVEVLRLRDAKGNPAWSAVLP